MNEEPKMRPTKDQYDAYLHKIQQEKMKELWNDKEDEAWDAA